MAECSSSNNQEVTNEEEMGVVTMVDVLNEEQELEEDANAVLGASDDKNCTYSQGYMKRQALYACLTCTPGGNENYEDCAGICLACSYNCHGSHKVIELYTKRDFRCDCGNKKFGERPCNLDPNKEDFNELNKYNQNFVGLYCTCHRPYPDEEDEVDDIMIQCIICEDWYHSRHLQTTVPSNENYSEMICMTCTSRLQFLRHYANLSVTDVSKNNKTLNTETTDSIINEEVDVETSTVVDLNTEKENPQKLDANEIVDTSEKSNVEQTDGDKTSENDSQIIETTSNKNIDLEAIDENEVSSVNDENEDDSFDIDGKKCLKPKKISDDLKGTTFWVENWREMLCACMNCSELYCRNCVEYLVRSDDTVKYYEEQGKAATTTNTSPSQYEAGLEALSSLDRVKQVEAISEYNEMKDRLKEYLQKFAENKKIVREEDIREFFASMTARKKQKVEIPHFCR